MRLLRFNALSVATKLRVVIVAACLVVIALTSATFLAYDWVSYRKNAVGTLMIRARILGVNASAALAFNSPEDATEILAALKTDPATASAVLYDAQGRPFARYAAQAGSPDPRFGAGAAEYDFDPDYLTVRVPVELKGRVLGTLAIKRSLADLYQELRRYGLLALAVMAIATFVALWISSRLQRIISDPVLALARVARRVTERKDYTVRAPRISSDEIGDLTEAFNTMLSAIHDSQEETSRLYAQVSNHASELEYRVSERTGQLLNANQELEAFGSSVSHDLRGPLRHIMGYAQILIEDHSPQMEPGVRDYLNKILDRAGQMEQLIDALLEFSRLSKQSLALEPVDIAAMCKQILDEFSPEMGNRQVEIRIGEIPTARADPTLLRQVLVNLLGNALKYSRTRSPAMIEVTAQEDRDEPPVYSIRDNGVGFDMQDADKLFTVFQRLHDAREFEGTGVGLATAQRIIQRHGGRIWAESAPGAGATFHFTLQASPLGGAESRGAYLPNEKGVS